MDLEPYLAAIHAYARVLETTNESGLKLWARRLGSSSEAQVEGAVAEAVVHEFLGCRGIHVSLAARDGGEGVDFRCENDGRVFFVEVTNLWREVVTNQTGLPEEFDAGFRTHGDLTELVKREMISKSRQCAGLTGPVALFVTTFHGPASHICVDRAYVEHILHSRPRITGQYDRERGEVVGELYQTTSMEIAAFTRAFSAEPARRHISAVVVAGFGMPPPKANVYGVLHPAARRPFGPHWLVDVPFCRFCTWPLKHGKPIHVEWTDTAPV